MTLYGLPYTDEAFSSASLAGCSYIPYANLKRITAPKSESDGPKTASTWYDWNANGLNSVVPRLKLSVAMSQAGVTFVQSQIVLPIGRYLNATERDDENPQSVTAGYIKSSITLPSFALSPNHMGDLRQAILANALMLLTNGTTGAYSNVPLDMLVRGNTNVAG